MKKVIALVIIIAIVKAVVLTTSSCGMGRQAYQGEGLPVIVIDTGDREIRNDVTYGVMTIYPSHEDMNNEEGSVSELIVNHIAINLNGYGFDIQLMDSEWEETTTYPLLGMSNDSDWALKGSRLDNSLGFEEDPLISSRKALTVLFRASTSAHS